MNPTPDSQIYSQLSIDCKSSGGESGDPNFPLEQGSEATVKSGQKSKSQTARTSECASGMLPLDPSGESWSEYVDAGRLDQKNPLQSGSSKTYGRRRVRIRTEDKTVCCSSCELHSVSVDRTSFSTALYTKVARLDGDSSLKARISAAGIRANTSVMLVTESPQNWSQNSSSFASIG